jgi:hypothetical protein
MVKLLKIVYVKEMNWQGYLIKIFKSFLMYSIKTKADLFIANLFLCTP